MKIRSGFVSNSSSSSFILISHGVPKKILDMMRNHSVACEKWIDDNDLQKENSIYGGINNERYGWFEDSWDVLESEHFIRFSASMDNFDLLIFAEDIGVPSDNIYVTEQNYEYDDRDPEEIYKDWSVKHRNEE